VRNNIKTNISDHMLAFLCCLVLSFIAFFQNLVRCCCISVLLCFVNTFLLFILNLMCSLFCCDDCFWRCCLVKNLPFWNFCLGLSSAFVLPTCFFFQLPKKCLSGFSLQSLTVFSIYHSLTLCEKAHKQR